MEQNRRKLAKSEEKERNREKKKEKDRKEIKTGRKLKMKVTQGTKFETVNIMVTVSSVLIGRTSCRFTTPAHFQMRRPPFAESVDLYRLRTRECFDLVRPDTWRISMHSR